MQKQKKFRFTKRLAESLIEVVIAIFVVSLSAGTASTLIVTALQSNSFSRDNLIALNLAREGLEAMRAIHDTNLLKFSFDQKNCWDLMPNETNCGQNNPHIQDAYYTAYLDADFTWQLTSQGSSSGSDLNLDSNNPTNSNYQLGIRASDDLSGKKIYSSDPNQANNPANFSVVANTDPFYGRFYRMIQVSHPDPNSMAVTSVVQWKSQNVVHSIKFSTLITN